LAYFYLRPLGARQKNKFWVCLIERIPLVGKVNVEGPASSIAL